MQSKITRKMVEQFAMLSGDFNKIHLDEDFAKTTIFKKCIVHGTFVSGFIGKKIADDFDSPILKSLNLSFVRPIYLESNIDIRFSDIVHDKNHITFKIKVFANDKECITGHSVIVLKR